MPGKNRLRKEPASLLEDFACTAATLKQPTLHTATRVSLFLFLWIGLATLFAQNPDESTVTHVTKAACDKDHDSVDGDPSAETRGHTPWEILKAGVGDDNSDRRAQAIAAVGTIGPQKRVIRLLEQALKDSDPSVRLLAARNLGELRARTAIPRLKAALDDDSPEVSFAAAKALWNMGDPSGRDVFLEVLSGAKSASPGLVKGQISATKKRLHDPAKLAMFGAKQAAGAIFGPAGFGIKLLEEASQDRSASARAMSAILLGPNPGPDGLQHLQDALSDKNWIVRAAAAQALGTTRRRDQIRTLQPMLDDEKAAVCYIAAASIVRLSSGNSRKATVTPATASSEVRPAMGPAALDTSQAH